MNSKRGLVLVLSIGLGVVAAFLNWLYLAEKGKALDTESFIAIADGVRVQRGDAFSDSQLVAVPIPRNRIGSLAHTAISYNDRQSVIGMPATRNFEEGELLFRSDLKSPPPELELQSEDERAMWIPVDTRTFIPSLVVPGDQVTFIVSSTPGPTLARVVEDSGDDSPAPAPRPVGGGNVETIGPFRILSLGNRLGTAEVMRAAGIPQTQENVMTISVRQIGGQLDPKAQKLWTLLRDTDFRQVGVLLHPRKSKVQ